MCTLTYLLKEDGYELFFNRDEQRTRSLAITPEFNQTKNAIYPIDPQGQGTWIAVNKQGLSLALLNYYQAPFNTNKNIVSRGKLILSLLDIEGDIIKHLETIDLGIYQPFQLCIFADNLSIENNIIHSLKWTGSELIIAEIDLPITSSSVDFDDVSEKRQRRFIDIVDKKQPSSAQHKEYHFSTDTEGKYSVNMQREDAKTVSISHISVNTEITFKYYDNVVHEEHTTTLIRESKLEFAS